MEDKNKIGAFFNTQLSDHKEEVSMFELEMMSARMSSYNFMKFNVLQFNVYYAVAIFSGFLLSLGLGTHYLSTYKKQESMLQETRQELALLKKELTTAKSNNHTTYPDDNAIATVPSSPSKPSKSNLTGKNNNLTQPPNSLSPTDVKRMNVASKTDQESSKSNLDHSATHTGAVSTAPVPLHEPTPTHSPKATELPTNPVENLASKKKVIIYKRDTIYQYDTLKVKKKSK